MKQGADCVENVAPAESRLMEKAERSCPPQWPSSAASDKSSRWRHSNYGPVPWNPLTTAATKSVVELFHNARLLVQLEAHSSLIVTLQACFYHLEISWQVRAGQLALLALAFSALHL